MDREAAFSQKRIHVYVNDRKLYFMEGQRTAKIYPVAVGKPETPTPTGIYEIINKIINPGGVLGTRWMGLSIPNGPYGIHGTFNPDSIGKFISNGCIRMYNHDIEELFSQVKVGTTVVIENLQSGSPLNGALYTVKPGDTLWKISRQFGVPLSELAGVNGIINPDKLEPGQVLIIP